ncbi:glycosyltransferase family 2 protein [Edaphobacter aggregans]|uniref:glycosyltransferase family 2 protein n=1 Tax=Edaphobacter aggregans TaxID=570835 RepID=UPI00068B0DE1|nr:glycosyltransferase family 2 protein [Edaphobacter aggregans]
MSLPLCSIIIPAYNAEVWLERTLLSAAKQNYPNLEIIVIDDGSKDDTRKLAESISAVDERFRVVSIPNGGVANARNVGIREARGKYVAFLDADDLWHPDKIRLQVESMQEPLDGALPAASYALARLINAHDRVVSKGATPGESGYILLRNMYFRFSGNGSSVLVLRDVALEVGGYDSSWIAHGSGGCEDIDFELAVAARYPIVCVQQLLVGYRRAPGSMSTRHREMARGALGVIQKHLKANPQIPKWATRLVYGALLGYTVPELIAGRDWPEAAKHLGILFINQPMQAIEFSLRFLKRQPKRLLRLLFKKPKSVEEIAGPLFTDVRPEIEPSEINTRHPRQREILDALTELDAKLWKEVIKGNINSSTHVEDNAGEPAYRVARN